MKVLITGGSGLVGTQLTEILNAKGNEVVHLSRKKFQHPIAQVFEWDVAQRKIDLEAFQNVDVIVNLAGSGVADGRWTAVRKQEILKSRVDSTNFLYEQVALLEKKPKVILSASGVGYYSNVPFEQISIESDPVGTSFLADVCHQWEQAADRFEEVGIRVVKCRIGVVLSALGGALPKIAQPIRWFAGAALGSGNQYMPWIHIDDLCEMIIFLIKNDDQKGVFNAVNSNPITNRAMTRAIAKVLNKPLLLPKIPALALKLALGEMSEIVLEGNKVSNQKILDAEFQFNYEKIDEMLQVIFKK